MAITAIPTGAQNLQSARNASQMHKNLLARQQRIKDQIKLEEAQKYASDLYEEVEPEPDIYTEGWESGLVNPFKESDVPQTKVINLKGYVMPIRGNYVTSHYGYRPAFGRNHKGVDLRCPMGDTVRAAFSGRVRLTKFERNGFGFYVIVRHENGLETVYGHLSRFLVSPNQTVKAGQPIALSGSTGRSTGPHLHFETRWHGAAFDPQWLIDFETGTLRHRLLKIRSWYFNPNQRYVQSVDDEDEIFRTDEEDRLLAEEQAKKEAAARAAAEAAAMRWHTVKSGDTLSGIARKYHTSVREICRLNKIKETSVLRIGQRLRVR